jgi:hypothetical protein
MVTSRNNRAILAAVILAATFIPQEAGAVGQKSYINSFTMILDFTDRGMMWAEKHKEDPRLAETCAARARANVKTVQELSPPPEFIDIHPHFVALVENSLGAFQAVADGDMTTYYKIKGRMKKERQSLNNVMSEQNFVFPEII